MHSVTFHFSRWEQGDLSGFDLGDISVIGQDGAHSSTGKTPDQSMMVYLAIAHLVSGVCELVLGREKTFAFVGADSSYSLLFARRRDQVSISAGRLQIGEVTTAELLQAISHGVQEFLAVPGNRLPKSDPVEGDLQAALRAMEQALAHIS